MAHSISTASVSDSHALAVSSQFGDFTKSMAKGLFGALEKGAAAAKKKIDDA